MSDVVKRVETKLLAVPIIFLLLQVCSFVLSQLPVRKLHMRCEFVQFLLLMGVSCGMAFGGGGCTCASLSFSLSLSLFLSPQRVLVTLPKALSTQLSSVSLPREYGTHSISRASPVARDNGVNWEQRRKPHLLTAWLTQLEKIILYMRVYTQFAHHT